MRHVLGTGLFIGRFQPFHFGHLAATRFALARAETLIIAVGSAEKSYERRNPFTAGERITMIRNALKQQASEVNLDNIMIIPVPDVDIHPLWTAHLMSIVPSFEVVFSSDPFTISLFEARHMATEQPPLYNRKEVSGTQVRDLIAQDGLWKPLVPSVVAEYILSIRGAERLKVIVSRESHHAPH